MAILVRGMKMPKNCGECYLSARTSLPSGVVIRCRLGGVVGTPIEKSNKRHPNCPLVALPDKHGRLVDADELKTAFPRCDNNMNIKIASVRATINHMDTIVESEDEA